MKHWYHATDAAKAASIMREGFPPGTLFCGHLEAAMAENGGAHVFDVLMDGPVQDGKFPSTNFISLERVEKYSIYRENVQYRKSA